MTVRLFVYGIVQGVGFRPFVMALAQEWNLRGTVCNTGSSVCIDLEGEESAISGFRKDLMMKAPKGLPEFLEFERCQGSLWEGRTFVFFPVLLRGMRSFPGSRRIFPLVQIVFRR